MRKIVLSVFLWGIAPVWILASQTINIIHPNLPLYFAGDAMEVGWQREPAITGWVRVTLRKSDHSKVYVIYNDCPYHHNHFYYSIPLNVEPGKYFVKVKVKNKPISGKSRFFPILSKKPDLIFNSIRITPEHILQYFPIKVRICVVNAGKDSAPKSRLQITILEETNKNFPPIIKYFRVRPIGGTLSKDHIYLEYTFTINKTGDFTIWMNLDVDHEVDESNEGNNNVRKSIKVETNPIR